MGLRGGKRFGDFWLFLFYSRRINREMETLLNRRINRGRTRVDVEQNEKPGAPNPFLYGVGTSIRK